MDSSDVLFEKLKDPKVEYFKELFLRCYEILGEEATVPDACDLARNCIEVSINNLGLDYCTITKCDEKVKELIFR